MFTAPSLLLLLPPRCLLAAGAPQKRRAVKISGDTQVDGWGGGVQGGPTGSSVLWGRVPAAHLGCQLASPEHLACQLAMWAP